MPTKRSTNSNTNKEKKSRADRFSWKKGDVQIRKTTDKEKEALKRCGFL